MTLEPKKVDAPLKADVVTPAPAAKPDVVAPAASEPAPAEKKSASDNSNLITVKFRNKSVSHIAIPTIF